MTENYYLTNCPADSLDTGLAGALTFVLLSSTLMGEDQTLDDVDYESETASLSENEKFDEGLFILDHMEWVKNHRKEQFELPETVSVIDCENQCKVYLVGTAHFSQESINDVKTVMEKTYPDIVVLELCASRRQTLTMDEEKIKQQLKDINLRTIIKSQGLSSGILHYLLLRLSGYLVDILGMAPGGEFRAAAREAMKQPHCHILLGDRPINITLYRAIEALGPWTKLKFFVSLLFSFQPVTKEEIEEMKKSDFLEKLLVTMAGDHPELTHILLDERDKYLARSIWEATGMEEYFKLQASKAATTTTTTATPNGPSYPEDGEESVVRHRDNLNQLGDNLPEKHTGEEEASEEEADTEEGEHYSNHVTVDNPPPKLSCCSNWPPPSVIPRVVVAVVGIGHVTGIKKFWPVAHTINKADLCVLLKPPLSWRIFKWILRGVLLSTVLGIGYGVVRCSYTLGSYTYRQMFM
ncbi:unnamed protein product [Trichobilharzia szidati]|nr:unnamed protein product [Trichobilharzia szidati]